MVKFDTTGTPQTFEARGIAIGFCKKLVAHARLRCVEIKGEAQWDLIVPSALNKPSQRNMMVIPWRHLPNYAELPVRDQLLFGAIESIPKILVDPFDVRAAKLQIDALEHPDDAMRSEAQKEQSREQADRRSVYLSLMANFTRELGVRMGDGFMAHADTNVLTAITSGTKVDGFDFEPEKLFNRVIGAMSQDFGMTSLEFVSRINEISDLLKPFGAVNIETERKCDGYLTRVRNRMLVFSQDLEDHLEDADDTESDAIAMLRFALKGAVGYVNERYDDLEQMCSMLRNVFLDFPKSHDKILHLRRDISYALDGWNDLIDIWNAAKDDGLPEDAQEQAKSQAIARILHVLPAMAKGELEDDDENSKVWSQFEFARASMVRMLVGWGTNEIDAELKERIEVARNREAERLGRDPLFPGRLA